MTPKKKAPAKRGRKPKPEGRFGQLTVRLPPNLKFGLELLANHQKRSLSEAMQWAVRVGLNSSPVNRERTVGDVLEQVWPLSTTAERVVAVYQIDPSLLVYEDRAGAQLIVNSAETAVISKIHNHRLVKITDKIRHDAPPTDLQSKQLDDLREWKREVDHWFTRFIIDNWEPLKKFAIEQQTQGKNVFGVSLAAAINEAIPKILGIADTVKKDALNP